MVKDLDTKFEFPIAGSLRIGKKDEKNIPQKLNYFTVHEDSHTIKSVVTQFNSKYEKAKELNIKFLSDNPLEVSYVRYGNSGLLCKGDGEKASCRAEKEWMKCDCSKECKYRGNACKLTGRLYFIIEDLNIGGLWRFQTQSYNTIRNFITILKFVKCMGIDIRQKKFRMATEERKSIVDGRVKKYVTVSLKMIEDTDKNDLGDKNKSEKISKINAEKGDNENRELISNNVKDNRKKQKKGITEKELYNENNASERANLNSDIDVDEYEKCIILQEIKEITIGENIVKKAIFCNMNDEIIELLLHPDIQEEISNWELASTIIPLNIYEKNNNRILKEYKEISVIKKAV